MTISLELTNQDTIEMADFCEYVDKNYTCINAEALTELAPMMKALCNNRTLLEDWVIKELKDPTQFQSNNAYSAQTLSFCVVPGKFLVRANIWLPEKDFHKVNGKGEQTLFAYYQAHDHNFDFMTIGYYGSGYVTDIYEYNNASVAGKIGEKVDIRFLETTSLPQGKIMIYRASKDIHIQKFPEEFSISLNLMGPPSTPVRDQFMFNIESSTIHNIIRSNYTGRKLLLEAAGYLANDNVSDILESIAKNHLCSRTREVARKAFTRRWPEQGAEMIQSKTIAI